MKISASTYVEGAWTPDVTGTHVPLPLDASAVPDAVVEEVAMAMCDALMDDGTYHRAWVHTSNEIREVYRYEARAAIAALAAALGEEG